MALRCFGDDENGIQASGIDKYWHGPLVSLEEATRALADTIPNLAASVADAKRNCLKSPHGLSRDESAAIYLYTLEMDPKSVYSVLNSILRRSNDTLAMPWFPYLKLLGTALKKLPRYDGCVWRIVEGDVARRYQKGTQVRWWAYTSCTKSVSVLKEFAPDKVAKVTMMMIECHNGREISQYSSFKNENEVLLLSGARFISADESLEINNMRVVHLQELTKEKPAGAPVIRSKTAVAHVPAHKEKTIVAPKTPKSAASKKLQCPYCFAPLIFSSSSAEGIRSTCAACHKSFQNVCCPACHQLNFWKNLDGHHYYAGVKVTCASCRQVFQHLNCPHCSRAAYWIGPNTHKPGLKSRCRYCSKEYRALNCPHCHEALYYKDDRYKAGLPTKCSYCQKTHQAINCPHCSQLNVWKDRNYQAGLKIKCYHCQKHFQHINCPKCSAPSIWQNADRIPGATVKCYDCQTIFQHLNCPHCKASHVWTGGEYRQRGRIHCRDCGNEYQHVICPHCKHANYFMKADLGVNDQVKCCSCHQTF